MGLREAVLEIADDAEQIASAWLDGDVVNIGDYKIYLQMVAKQLRSAVKASEGEACYVSGDQIMERFGATKQPELDGGVILKAHGCDPNGPAKALVKQLERTAEREEGGVRMVEILDGSNDGLCEMHQVPMSMQVGQAIDVGRRVFVLTRLDSGTLQLHLHAAETERRFGKKGSIQ